MSLSAVPKDVSKRNALNFTFATANVGTCGQSLCEGGQWTQGAESISSSSALTGLSSTWLLCRSRVGLLYDSFCAGASELKSGYDDRVELCWIISKPSSPQLPVARVVFHGVALSVISAHAPTRISHAEGDKRLFGVSARSSSSICFGCW